TSRLIGMQCYATTAELLGVKDRTLEAFAAYLTQLGTAQGDDTTWAREHDAVVLRQTAWRLMAGADGASPAIFDAWNELWVGALESRVRGAGGRRSAPGNQVRYVMTDVAGSTIAFWRTHEALAPFVAAGRLDFARFDADRDRTPSFARDGRALAPGRIVVIA